MKIVILDGAVVNPGDLSWEGLAGFGACTVYGRTPPEEVVSRARDAEIVLTNKVYFTGKLMEQCPRLQYIGALATGYNNIDVAAARRLGIAVTNVPAYSTHAVAQFTMALLLELCHHAGRHADGVQAGKWVKAPDFCYWETPQLELWGKRFGVFGMGQIGQAAGALAHAFRMEVLYCSRHEKTLPYPARKCGIEELLAEVDILSLHCPLTADTFHLIDGEALSRMKDGAILLNTARGPLVDEQAVTEALKSGKLGGYGADVSESEPMAADSPLLGAPNCIVTPHIAWASKEARGRLINAAVENVRAFLRGERKNRVDKTGTC